MNDRVEAPAHDGGQRRRLGLPGLVALAGVLAAALLALVWTVTAIPPACGCSPTLPPSPSSPTGGGEPPASPVDGVVIAVDSEGLGQVRGFTLRPAGLGVGYEFTLGSLENPTDFSPGHLAEHMASSQAIRVWFRVENDVRVVYRLEDAPG